MKNNYPEPEAMEEWMFVREDGFYYVDVPAGSDVMEQVRLNPGTREVLRMPSMEALYPLPPHD